MSVRITKPNRQPRVADEIMAGMLELSRMMDEGRTPEQMFTVRTIEVPETNKQRPDKARWGAPRAARKVAITER
jgi:hypothetical protein